MMVHRTWRSCRKKEDVASQGRLLLEMCRAQSISCVRGWHSQVASPCTPAFRSAAEPPSEAAVGASRHISSKDTRHCKKCERCSEAHCWWGGGGQRATTAPEDSAAGQKIPRRSAARRSHQHAVTLAVKAVLLRNATNDEDPGESCAAHLGCGQQLRLKSMQLANNLLKGGPRISVHGHAPPRQLGIRRRARRGELQATVQDGNCVNDLHSMHGKTGQMTPQVIHGLCP